MKKIISINKTELYDFFLLYPSEIDFIMERLFVYILKGYMVAIEQHYVEIYGGAEGKYLVKIIRNKEEFLQWYSKVLWL